MGVFQGRDGTEEMDDLQVAGGTGFGVTKTAPRDLDTQLAPAPALCANCFISKVDDPVSSGHAEHDHHVLEMGSQTCGLSGHSSIWVTQPVLI